MKTVIIIFVLGVFSIQKISSQSGNGKSQCVKSDTFVNGIQIPCSGQLLFSDDFDGNTLDAFRWNTSSKYYLKDGKLHLPVDSSSGNDPVIAVTSNFSFLFGRIDIRARIALGTADKVDFSMGFGTNSYVSKIYFGNVSNSLTKSNYYEMIWWLHYEFHIYTLIWHRNSYAFVNEGQSIFKIHNSGSTNGNERHISFEISKDFSGLALNNEMIIDYIRVYSTDEDNIIAPCEATVTEVWPPPKKPFCKGDSILEEYFLTFDERKWTKEIRAPRINRDEEFVLYDGKLLVENKLLYLKPILWTDYRPDLDIMGSSLNLKERCTSIHNSRQECFMRAIGQFIMPPIVVPRITTRNSFSFKYGRVEIKAKFPKGDWIVPLLLLEPLVESYGRNGYESGELRIAMARGNENLESKDGRIISGQTLFGGPVLSTEARWRDHFMVNRTEADHFGDEYHHYSMTWGPKELQFSVDGESYGVIPNTFKDPLLNKKWKSGGAMAPFDTLFYISLGISVGGFGDFTNDVKTELYNKPWINYDPKARLHFWQEKNKWYPSWKQPQLIIDYVIVTAI